jgi:protein-disulfide isomerase-like protein with CxxC motif
VAYWGRGTGWYVDCGTSADWKEGGTMAAEAVALYAEYFGDPLCPWCWGNEPRHRALKVAFGGAIFWVNRMGGLEGRVPAVDDADEAVRRMERVSQATRMPIALDAWRHRAPCSPIPASIAVKAVGFQDPALEDRFLRRVREAFFVEGRRADTSEALLTLAAEVPGIDLKRLAREMHDRGAKKAFMVDFEAARDPLPEARALEKAPDTGGTRYAFPTLVLKNRDGAHRVLSMEHDLTAQLAAVHALAPDLRPQPSPSIEAFLKAHRSAATEEVALACEVPYDAADADLADMVQDGRVTFRAAGHYGLWRWKGGRPRPGTGLWTDE